MQIWCQIFTDRVRSTREGYVLTRVCPSICLSTGGWGVPHLARGVPQPGPARGAPGQVWWGGVPQGGVPPGRGYPQQWYPPAGQEMEYLIRRGRCASGVHAGGLSCLTIVSRRAIKGMKRRRQFKSKVKDWSSWKDIIAVHSVCFNDNFTGIILIT